MTSPVYTSCSGHMFITGSSRLFVTMKICYTKEVCFVDCKKAFDKSGLVMLMKILENIGVDWRHRKLIWNLCQGQSAYVRLEES